MSIEVVLATHNQHKVQEFQRILGAAMPEITVVAYDGPEPVEDGVSFSENALIKARTAAAHTGKISLADDSGISVDVLGGAPGIFSARWSGPGHSDTDNLNLLLAQLADIADKHRSATFRCTIALVVPEGLPHGGFEHVSEGVWPGRLARQASGAHGFGYDPIFVPEGHEVSSAELPPEKKNEISHRARAFADLVPTLRTLI